MARQTKAQKAERERALEELRELLPPGSTVHTILRHVSKSGMQREISCKRAFPDGQIADLDYLVSQVLGDRIGKHGGIVVGGCGMDMGFHIVHSLSYALHGMNDVGPDAIAKSAIGHPYKPTDTQFRAGYSLEHKWL